MTDALLSPLLPDLFITGELDSRAVRPVDRELEQRALRDLVSRLAEAPQDVLPRLVDLAMDLTGGLSAGLSLYEPDPRPGQFRWRHLQGSLSPFEGAATPRDYSPCGVTLDRDEPTLCRHPERFYGWISDAAIEAPEVLLVPLRLQGGGAFGTLWIVSEREGHFTRAHADTMANLAWFVGVAVRMVDDREKIEQALEDQRTLTREMSHRVKNLFAVTDAMIRLSRKSAPSVSAMADSLSGRLHALANAHALVSRHLNEVGHAPRASDIETVVSAVLEPHDDRQRGGASRFATSGPPIACGDHAINGLALVLHELATNAIKYGALSLPGGWVEIAWRDADPFVEIEWTEHQGPALDHEPLGEGYGTSLVKRTVEGQFGGKIERRWASSGLAVQMKLMTARISS